MPWLDLANHAPQSAYSHDVDAAGRAFELRCPCGGFQPGQEVLICYGEQDNRCAHATAKGHPWVGQVHEQLAARP